MRTRRYKGMGSSFSSGFGQVCGYPQCTSTTTATSTSPAPRRRQQSSLRATRRAAPSRRRARGHSGPDEDDRRAAAHRALPRARGSPTPRTGRLSGRSRHAEPEWRLYARRRPIERRVQQPHPLLARPNSARACTWNRRALDTTREPHSTRGAHSPPVPLPPHRRKCTPGSLRGTCWALTSSTKGCNRSRLRSWGLHRHTRTQALARTYRCIDSAHRSPLDFLLRRRALCRRSRLDCSFDS